MPENNFIIPENQETQQSGIQEILTKHIPVTKMTPEEQLLESQRHKHVMDQVLEYIHKKANLTTDVQKTMALSDGDLSIKLPDINKDINNSHPGFAIWLLTNSVYDLIIDNLYSTEKAKAHNSLYSLCIFMGSRSVIYSFLNIKSGLPKHINEGYISGIDPAPQGKYYYPGGLEAYEDKYDEICKLSYKTQELVNKFEETKDISEIFKLLDPQNIELLEFMNAAGYLYINEKQSAIPETLALEIINLMPQTPDRLRYGGDATYTKSEELAVHLQNNTELLIPSNVLLACVNNLIKQEHPRLRQADMPLFKNTMNTIKQESALQINRDLINELKAKERKIALEKLEEQRDPIGKAQQKESSDKAMLEYFIRETTYLSNNKIITTGIKKSYQKCKAVKANRSYIVKKYREITKLIKKAINIIQGKSKIIMKVLNQYQNRGKGMNR